MRFNIIHLGRINIERGIVSKYRGSVDKSRIAYREADQFSMDADDEDEIFRRLADVQVVCPIHDGSILAYRNVGWHSDDWDKCANSRGKWVAPGFLHVMLSGECEITVGRKTITARRGDVFLLNPNVIHMVRTNRLCMTYTSVVPAYEVLSRE